MIGIIGGGIGGLTLAAALAKAGEDVVVFERSARFGQVGADINLTPNSTRALDGLGGELGQAVRNAAARPSRRLSRTWDTGEVTSDLPMGDDAEVRYGAPQLTIHRDRLLSALVEAVPERVIRLGHRLKTLEELEDGRVRLRFHDRDEAVDVDAVVGADGIHSAVREELFGPDEAEYTGLVAYRAVIPAAELEGVPNLDAFTKWWGPDPARQIVTFPLNRGQDIFVFATVAQADWAEESWTTTAHSSEFIDQYEGFHPDAYRLLEGAGEVMKSALRVREPMESWGRGPVTLLGDACHPMTPFMAQGAGQAIEDAVVLSRAITEGTGSLADRFRVYEDSRRERTARVQVGSRANDWLKAPGDADWLYGYDAWTVALPQ